MSFAALALELALVRKEHIDTSLVTMINVYEMKHTNFVCPIMQKLSLRKKSADFVAFSRFFQSRIINVYDGSLLVGGAI